MAPGSLVYLYIFCKETTTQLCFRTSTVLCKARPGGVSDICKGVEVEREMDSESPLCN